MFSFQASESPRPFHHAYSAQQTGASGESGTQ
jgi:hypothetical protein